MLLARVGLPQALVRDQLLLDPVPHESAQQQGSLLVAYSVAANQVGPHLADTLG